MNGDIVAELRERVQTLEEEIKQLREDAAQVDGTFACALSKQQLALLMALRKRSITTYAYLDYVTEDHGKYNRYEGEMHQTLRTKVAVWKLRKALKAYDIEIKVWRGIGYHLDDANRAKLEQLMENKNG